MSNEPQEIARTFARLLLQDLGTAKFIEIRRRNRAQTDIGICHSHDFCDANVVMEAALREHGVPVFDEAGDEEMSDAVMRLWNQVWDFAKARYLTA